MNAITITPPHSRARAWVGTARIAGSTRRHQRKTRTTRRISSRHFRLLPFAHQWQQCPSLNCPSLHILFCSSEDGWNKSIDTGMIVLASTRPMYCYTLSRVFGVAENQQRLRVGCGYVLGVKYMCVWVYTICVCGQPAADHIQPITQPCRRNLGKTIKCKKTKRNIGVLLIKREKYKNEIITTHSNASYSSLTKPILMNPFVNHWVFPLVGVENEKNLKQQ